MHLQRKVQKLKKYCIIIKVSNWGNILSARENIVLNLRAINASEFLVNLEEMLPLYCMHSDVIWRN